MIHGPQPFIDTIKVRCGSNLCLPWIDPNERGLRFMPPAILSSRFSIPYLSKATESLICRLSFRIGWSRLYYFASLNGPQRLPGPSHWLARMRKPPRSIKPADSGVEPNVFHPGRSRLIDEFIAVLSDYFGDFVSFMAVKWEGFRGGRTIFPRFEFVV